MKSLITWLEKSPLTHKLVVGFACLLLFALLLGLYGLHNQQALSRQIANLYEKDIQGVSNAKDAQIDYATMGRLLRQSVITQTPEGREQALKQWSDYLANLRREIAELRPRSFRAETIKALDLFEVSFARYASNSEKAVALIQKGQLEEARQFISTPEFHQQGDIANEALDHVVTIKENGLKAATEEIQRREATATFLTWIMLASGGVMCIVLSLLVGRLIRRPANELRETVEQLAAGRLELIVPFTDFPNEIGELARSVAVLQAEAKNMEAQRWVKTNQAEISNVLQTAGSFTEIAQKFLSSVAPLIKAGHGVFYIYEEDQQRLRLLGGYAFRERKNLDTYFAVGQGLVGQCALERAPIIITRPPADYIRIGSSLGEAVPNTIAVLPVVLNERLLAVIELATFESFGANEQALLDSVMPILAMSMEIIERNAKTRQLLEETQRQADSMEKQAAKLEEQAVEMEAQQHEIKATEAWFRSIVESAPDGMLVADEHGTIILTNHQVEAMFGYQPGELAGNPIETLVPQDVRGHHVALRDNYIHDENARPMQASDRKLRGARKDGTEFPVEIGLARLPAVGGRGNCVSASIRDITARKEAEERLAMAEERSRLILGAVGDGIVGLDNDGSITFANPAAPAMLGYREDEFVGRKMHALVHHHYPDGREFPREECSMYLSSVDGQARAVDSEVLWHKDGSPIPVEYATTPVIKDGTIVGTVTVYRDITARREAEERLSAAEEQSRLILASIKEGLCGLDLDGNITFLNHAGAELLGFTEAEMIGNCMHTMVHHTLADGSAYPAETCHMRLTMQDGIARTISDEVLWRKDGSSFPTEYTSTPIHKDGALVGSVVAFRDISERKAAEQALKHINFLNDQALGLTKAGYWHVPLDGSGWYNSSKRAVDIFGDIPNDGYRYRLTEDWFVNVEAGDPEYAKATGQNFQEAIEGKVPAYDSIYAYKRPVDGRVVWIHAYGTVTRDAEGKATDMYGVTQDITEYMHAQQQLAKSMQIAEEATKAKSDFLANMSHEIRTPMNAIIGMSHLALQTKLDKKQKNYIEKVRRAGENLLGIINDILDFSKIEAGKMTMEKVDFRLEDVMDHLANLVGLKAEDKGLELLFDAAQDVPTALVGDPLRLGQVLINLGNNAVKFTEQGEIVVGIEKVAEDENDVELHFWVRDSGIGMTPEQCGKMFQSFSQADASTTRKYGGTGLGLAISKNLVEQMQGRIWVESEAGKGSTFHFHARFGLQKNPTARRMFRAEELQGVRVLVVDDNASAREILSTMARNFGLEVDTAQDGEQALKMIGDSDQKHSPYELVLMDWKMPGMDGVETAERLQGEHLHKLPAVIMVTAYGREEVLGSAEVRGVRLSTVLSKPVNPSTLLEAIGEVLGRGIEVETRASEKAEDYAEVMAQLSGARLLLVEDNDMNQELALELLNQAGIDVVIANNGQEALDILAKDAAFDGVLMDCQMPVMDGYTATRDIRKNPAFNDLPIIAMTANAMAGDREKVIEAGMWDHIAKPLNVTEMYATIAKWVKPSGAPGGAAVDATAQLLPTEGLPPLPGIDVTAGLATTMNNHKLYTRMLIKFRDSQGRFGELFDAARQDSDPAAAERAAHTLKGTAGNIGARAVQAAAGELEHACHAGADETTIEALLAKVLTELVPVISGLKQVGAKETSAGNAEQGLATKELRAALDRLAALLEDNDAAAGDLLGDLLERMAGTPEAGVLKAVADAVNEYDFDAALVKLKNTGLVSERAS